MTTAQSEVVLFPPNIEKLEVAKIQACRGGQQRATKEEERKKKKGSQGQQRRESRSFHLAVLGEAVEQGRDSAPRASA